MLGGFKKTTKRNLLKGIPWRFGPNWPGKRCEAKTRNSKEAFLSAMDLTMLCHTVS